MKFKVKKTVRGNVRGEALVFSESLSFNGDIDIRTGEIITDNSGLRGESVSNKVLLFKENKGSSGGATVLQTLRNLNLLPLAIVSVKPADFNLVEAAILIRLPYASLIDEASLTSINSGQMVKLDLDKEFLEVES